MTRIEDIRLRLGWTQPQMAEYLGQSQANVSRMKSGQKESGSVRRLLDLLEVRLEAVLPGSAASEGVQS